MGQGYQAEYAMQRNKTSKELEQVGRKCIKRRKLTLQAYNMKMIIVFWGIFSVLNTLSSFTTDKQLG